MANLDVLFVGFNPGIKSGETGHHFAGPGNLFWALLADSGLTGRRLTPVQDHDLLFWKLGLVNIVDRVTPGSQDLTVDELVRGATRVRSHVAALSPKVVAFLGKDIFRYYRQMVKSQPVDWGIQPDGLVPGVWESLLPNPSRRSTILYALRLRYFQELQHLVVYGPHPKP